MCFRRLYLKTSIYTYQSTRYSNWICIFLWFLPKNLNLNLKIHLKDRFHNILYLGLICSIGVFGNYFQMNLLLRQHESFCNEEAICLSSNLCLYRKMLTLLTFEGNINKSFEILTSVNPACKMYESAQIYS